MDMDMLLDATDERHARKRWFAGLPRVQFELPGMSRTVIGVDPARGYSVGAVSTMRRNPDGTLTLLDVQLLPAQLAWRKCINFGQPCGMSVLDKSTDQFRQRVTAASDLYAATDSGEYHYDPGTSDSPPPKIVHYTAPSGPAKCECGSVTCGSNAHSDWCPAK